MRTIHDVEDAIAGIADRAPAQLDLDALTTTQHEPRRARGQKWAIAAVAATVAVVSFAVPTLLSGLHRDSRDVPAASGFSAPLPLPSRGSALQFGFTVDAAPGEHLNHTSLWADGQTALFTSTASCRGLVAGPDRPIPTVTCTPLQAPPGAIFATQKVRGGVAVYYQGAFDPTQAKRGEPVDVNGRPGYYADLQVPDGPDDPTLALAWEYAPGAWAIAWDLPVGGAGDDVKATELRHAKATHAATVAPLTPIKVQGLPAQLYTGSMDYFDDWTQGSAGLNDQSAVQWGISWAPHLTPGDPDHTSEVTINGRVWTAHDSQGSVTGLEISVDGIDFAINHVGTAATLQQYVDTASHVEFAANLHDTGTWFEAAVSMPH